MIKNGSKKRLGSYLGWIIGGITVGAILMGIIILVFQAIAGSQYGDIKEVRAVIESYYQDLDNQKEVNYISIEEIPEVLKDVVVTSQDERFYEHNGVDYKRIMNAIVSNVKEGSLSKGATTITGQIIKKSVAGVPHSIGGKIREGYLAKELEKYYSKDQILEYYINTISLDGEVKGLSQGSQKYFNKAVSDLSLGEAAALVVMIDAPTRYNIKMHPDFNKQQVEVLLDKLVTQNKITDSERQNALKNLSYDSIKK